LENNCDNTKISLQLKTLKIFKDEFKPEIISSINENRFEINLPGKTAKGKNIY
jgi:hypothetical protein